MTPPTATHPLLPYTHEPVLDRRDFLRVGGLLAAGACTSLPRLRATAREQVPGRPGGRRSCIFVYLVGGPPHLDMWDLKPNAPAEIRGPFRPIATSVPGFQVSEHLPRMARLADRYAIVRSFSHPNSNHMPMMYYTLTGHHVENPIVDNDTTPPLRTDYPHIGAAVARLRPPLQRVPGFVSMPELATRSNGSQGGSGTPIRGGRAGFLGAAFDPLCINGDPRMPDSMPGLVLPVDVTPDRFNVRDTLRAALDGQPADSTPARNFDDLHRAAVHLTGASRASTSTYALSQEPATVRDRYGPNRFGQSLLMSRRLVEAGTPFVSVHFNKMSRCDGWDLHGKNFESLKDELLPMFDQAMAALLDDLEQRSLLEKTLVVVMGEFGRTPRINANGGRDHWGPCQSIIMAGAGIRGGQVYGASDSVGAYPRDGKVDPLDVHATMYHCLGIDPEQEIPDQLQRPQKLCSGKVIGKLI